MFRIDAEGDAEVGADRFGVGGGLTDQVRCGDRFSANEKAEPDVGAEGEREDDQDRKDDIAETSLHRCSGRSRSLF